MLALRSNIYFISAKFTLKAQERLKSRKIIQQLFECGLSFSHFPFRVIYQQVENSEPLKAAFSVSSRNFKKAVHRNRIKRLMRESWRKQKLPLKQSLSEGNKSLAVFIIYTGKEIPQYHFLYEKMGGVLSRLEEYIGRT